MAEHQTTSGETTGSAQGQAGTGANVAPSGAEQGLKVTVAQCQADVLLNPPVAGERVEAPGISIGIAAFRGDRGLRAGLVVVAAAFVIPAVLTASAWQVRFDESATSDLDDASLGRVTLDRQAITMAGDHPVVGVGPNRYMAVLEARYTVDETYPYVVHSEPLMLAAELGIPAAVVVTLLLVWAGAQAVRAGYRPLLLYAAPLAFVVFDVLLYNKPVGLLLFAGWSGVLAAVSTAGRESLVASRESR